MGAQMFNFAPKLWVSTLNFAFFGQKFLDKNDFSTIFGQHNTFHNADDPKMCNLE